MTAEPTTHRSRLRLVLFATLLLGVVTMAAASPASAHTGDQSYVYLDVYERTIEGRLEFPVKDINRVFGTSLPVDTEPGEPQLLELTPRLQDYARSRFDLGANGEKWPIRYTDLEWLQTENGGYGLIHFEVEGERDIPRTLDIRYEALLDTDPGHNAFLIIANYWKGGIFANEADYLLVFDQGNRSQSFDLESPSFWKGFRTTIDLGVEHIRIGADHILFIIALLLPSVLVFTGSRWEPGAKFTSSLWRVLKIATSFTIAHSITLTLAGLGVFELPGRLVETMIAVSIILAALHNFRPVFANKEWLVAFTFGLFHGLGFAGLLEDLGLTRTNKVWSLLGFNLGVELGQAAIIIMVFPILFVLRRLPIYRWILDVGSVLLAIVAFGWMLERIFARDLGVSRVIDPIMQYPRVIGVLAVIAAAAVGWYYVEKGRGMLRPVAGSSLPDGTGGSGESERLAEPVGSK